MLVYIQPIRCISRQETIEDDVAQVAVPSVGFDHEDLVPTIRVHVPVQDILDCRARTERPDRASAGLVTPDAFDKDVVRWRLDSHALVPVRNFYVMDPVVRALRKLLSFGQSEVLKSLYL